MSSHKTKIRSPIQSNLICIYVDNQFWVFLCNFINLSFVHVSRNTGRGSLVTDAAVTLKQAS